MKIDMDNMHGNFPGKFSPNQGMENQLRKTYRTHIPMDLSAPPGFVPPQVQFAPVQRPRSFNVPVQGFPKTPPGRSLAQQARWLSPPQAEMTGVGAGLKVINGGDVEHMPIDFSEPF